MNEARFPYDYIADPAQGRPLFNAALYYGIPDLDPEILANQVQVSVRQEDGSVIAVDQPLNTGFGGIPLYNGSPVTVLIDEFIFSFKALNSLGAQIYYEARAEASPPPESVVGTQDTYADVRALTASYPLETIIVGGANTLGDGGVGVFTKSVSGVDNGGSILEDLAGNGWNRSDLSYPAPEWFYDGASSWHSAINTCLSIFGICHLEEDKTYNIEQGINLAGRTLRCGKRTIINCVSPTANGRFGGVATTQAAIYSHGTTGNPVYGSAMYGGEIHCNGLINATGSVGLKGLNFLKSHECYAESVIVRDCASYAFWVNDLVGNTDYASATFVNCIEYDAEIGFEAVNVSTAKFIACESYKTKAVTYPVSTSFTAYGLTDDASVEFTDCTSIADAVSAASTCALFLLKCRNITISGGLYTNKVVGNSSVFFEEAGGDFDNISLQGVTVRSQGGSAINLTTGALAATGQRISFSNCDIKANNNVGLVLSSSVSGVYDIAASKISSVRVDAGAAIAVFENAGGNICRVSGGELFASGGAGTTAYQMADMLVSGETLLTPAGTTIQRVIQRVIGNGTLANDGTYSYLNTAFSGAADMSKVVVTAMVDATGAADGAAAAALATTISFVPLDTQNIRLYAPTAAAGRSVAFSITEYSA